jgi:hypothetical protein
MCNSVGEHVVKSSKPTRSEIICSGCGTARPATSFYCNRRVCKRCCIERGKRRYRTNPRKFIDYRLASIRREKARRRWNQPEFKIL